MKLDLVNPNLAKVLKYFGYTTIVFARVKLSTKHKILKYG